MPASPADLIAAAYRLDLSVFTEHSTGCPDWYRAHQIDNAATRDRRCDCGLDEQLEAVEMLATFVRDLLGQEPVAWEVQAATGRSLTDSHGDSVDALVFFDELAARDRATRDMCDCDECPEHPDCKAAGCESLEVAPLYAIRATAEAGKGGG